jgi:hypothetical protein
VDPRGLNVRSGQHPLQEVHRPLRLGENEHLFAFCNHVVVLDESNELVQLNEEGEIREISEMQERNTLNKGTNSLIDVYDVTTVAGSALTNIYGAPPFTEPQV